MDRGHEVIKVIRAHVRRTTSPVRPSAGRAASKGVDGDPVGMRVADIVVGRVRIGPRDNHHTLLTTARYQITERVAVGQPLTAVVEGDLGGIVGDAAAGAQAGRIAKSAV